MKLNQKPAGQSRKIMPDVFADHYVQKGKI
jgi:hypothetical protein